MKPSPKAVVTGTGRCGTRFMMYVLRGCGASANHEAYYVADGFVEDETVCDIDCSWMAAPLLHKNPERHVVHLVRDPLQTIRSLINVNILANYPLNRWSVFLRKALPDAFKPFREIDRAAVMYCCWNDGITQTKPAARIRVEDITPDAYPDALKDLVTIGGGNPDMLPEVIRECPTNINDKLIGGIARKRETQIEIGEISLPDVREAIERIAIEYGYDGYGPVERSDSDDVSQSDDGLSVPVCCKEG